MLPKINGAFRLTKQPEIRYIPNSETSITTFSVAASEKYKDKEKSCFYDVKAWSKKGEVIAEHFNKGDQIIIFGKLEQERFEADGQKRSKHVITLEEFEFGQKSRNNSSNDNYSSGGKIDEDDIPF